MKLPPNCRHPHPFPPLVGDGPGEGNGEVPPFPRCGVVLCRLALLVLLAWPEASPASAAEPASGSAFPYLRESPSRVVDWDAKAFGNHRAVLKVGEKASAVWAHIPWCRRDAEPEQKNIILIEEGSGLRVTNLAIVHAEGAYGDLVFEAQRPGTFFAYYLPCVSRGKNYPTVAYQKPEQTADAVWLARIGFDPVAPSSLAEAKFPRATFLGLEADEAFDSFFPMEIAATPGALARLAAAHPADPFLLFPEDRFHPIRMSDHLPELWAVEGPKRELAGQVAARGEFFTFQVGLYALGTNLRGVSVRFTRLRPSAGGRSLPASAFRCFNTGGTNWEGVAFQKNLSIEKGRVQAFWCGVQIPKDLPPGEFRARVTIQPTGLPARSIDLRLSVQPDPIADSGDNEPSRQSRLRWLDSNLARDNEVVRPFTPLHVAKHTLSLLGRRVTLGPTGIPAEISSYFNPEVTGISQTPKPVLSAPMEFVVEDAAGQRLPWRPGALKFTKTASGLAEWTARATAGSLEMDVAGAIECDGFARFKVTLRAARTTTVRDLRLEIPLAKAAAKYMMGLGLKGGARPANVAWNWDVKKDQDSVWIGDADAGVQVKLKGENYRRPLLTNFYEDGPLNLPPAWFNQGRGGISIREDGAVVLVSCYSRARRLEAGQELHFDFELLLTPFRPLDTAAQWRTRFFHSFKPVDEVVRSGANTVNVHHANAANPYINYPFLHVPQMKTYVDEAHQQGLKVKIYYTIRELSNHAAELFALRSLGDEIFPHGKGGGDAWLQEHLGSDYMPGWFVPQWKDAALINCGRSRWDNYYVEGLDWLVKHVGIDGIYIDDMAFDRTTMKRVRKVLDRGRPGSLIDFHSANQYNPRDGFGNNANVYLEHFPYIDRLWFGEYFDPNSPPDYWLVEMSGIPFGLMSEMLQDGGNRWRGMLYGMTSRLPYDQNDPSPLWKVWDEFKIQDSRMMGYWSARCPVKTDHPNVLATAYVGRGKTLISLASWAAEDVSVKLSFDWQALGLDPANLTLTAPEVLGFQSHARFQPGDAIPVLKGKGWLLRLEPK